MQEEFQEEFGEFHGKEYFNIPPTRESIIDNFLYKNDTICISSEPGTGKSILALQLMFNLSTGTDFLGKFKISKPRKVCYIQSEGDRAETVERSNNMNKILDIDTSNIVHINVPGMYFNTDHGLEYIIKRAKRHDVDFDVIIFDPLYTTIKGSMNNDDVATSWVMNARKFKGKYNAALIVMHHDSKQTFFEGKAINKGNKDIFGSVFWSAFFNHNFKFRIKNGRHVLETGKQRSGNIVKRIEMKLVEPSPLLFIDPDSRINSSSIKVISFMKNMDKEFSIVEIQKMSGVSRSNTFNAVSSLIEEGLVTKNNSNPISYKWNKNGH